MEPPEGYLEPPEGYLEPPEGYLEPPEGYIEPPEGAPDTSTRNTTATTVITVCDFKVDSGFDCKQQSMK